MTRRLAALLFVILALPPALTLALLLPLGEVADEPAHVLRADSLLHGEWIGHRAAERARDGTLRPREGVDADAGLLQVVVAPIRPADPTPVRVDPRAWSASRSIPFGSTMFIGLDLIGGYFPGFYLPAAAGLGWCRFLGLGAFDGFVAARLANLFAALVLGAGALLLARRAVPVLFAILLLPPMIGLMGSANQDAVLIPAAVLAAALATRIRSDLPPLRQPCFDGAALLLALIALAKPPYLPLSAMLLLPAGAGWRRPLPSAFGTRTLVIGGIAAVVTAWTVLNLHHAATPIYRGPQEAGPLWPGPRPAVFTGTDPRAQLRVILAEPGRLVWLPWRSLLHGDPVFDEVVDALGWLNIRLPRWLVLSWAVSLVVAPLGRVGSRGPGPPGPEAKQEAGPGRIGSVLLAAAAAGALLLVYLGQYLTWTPVGADLVGGMQGRYLMPLLPVLGVALPAGQERRSFAPWLPLLPTVLAAGCGIWVIPRSAFALFSA